MGDPGTRPQLDRLNASAVTPSCLPAPARNTGRRREEVTKILFVVPAALTLIALFGYPVVKNALMGFQDYSLSTFFTGQAPFVGFDNYTAVFSDPVFGKAVVNTALFTVVSIAGQFVIGMLLALFFYRDFPLNGVLRALFLLPWLLPLIVGSTTWRAILELDSGILNVTLEHLHVIDTPIPWLTSPQVALISVILVNIWLGIPFNLTLLYSGLQDIPEDLYEAAALDGANRWKAFWYITWPSLRSVVIVTLTLGVVYTLKVLDIILGLTKGGPANATETIALQSYQRSFVDFKFGQGAALSNILILVSLVFAIVYLRLARRRIDE
jgi:multiple sugar transport system permease protein